jgi:hypothetical protein
MNLRAEGHSQSPQFVVSRSFRARHAKVGMVQVALVVLAGCGSASGNGPPPAKQDDPSVTAAQDAATSHCRCYVPDPAQFPGDSEATCVTNETDALKTLPYTCTPDEFSSCLDENNASCQVPAVAGGACGSCFGS